MSLRFQKQKDMPITEYDMSGLASLADSMGGIIGGAWDKLKSRKYKLDDPSSLEGSGMDEEEYMALVKQRQAGYEDTDPDFSGDRLSGTSEQVNVVPKTSIAQDLLGMVSGAWDSITDRGATVQDYFANYQRDEPAPDRFGPWRTNRQSTTNIPDYLKNPDYSPTAAPNLMLQAWNNDSNRQISSLTPTFNVQKWSE
jgi:hypothetical protein